MEKVCVADGHLVETGDIQPSSALSALLRISMESSENRFEHVVAAFALDVQPNSCASDPYSEKGVVPEHGAASVQLVMVVAPPTAEVV
jgi:hypothetical protein